MSLLDDVSIVVTPNGYKAGELYAVIPSDGAADMDVTRATAATRVDENGLVNYAQVVSETEEVTDGNFPTPNTAWDLFNGATISGGKANIVGDGSSFGYIEQTVVFTNGKIYKITLDAVITSGLGLKVMYGVSFANVIGEILTSGSYTFYYTAASSTSIIIGRKTGGTAYDSSVTNVSVKQVDRDNVPRIDYTGGGCPHILAEPQRTNLIPYSSDFTVGNWAKTRCTVTSNQAISPDGTLNADLMTSTDDDARLGDQVGSSGAEYTQSIYVKSAQVSDVNCQIDFAGLNTVTFTANQQWQRVETTLTDTSQSPRLRLRILNSGNSIYVWGGQLEEGSYPTSYIPTSGSTVTRNQDVFTRDGISSLINSTEGVLFAEINFGQIDTAAKYICVSDGTTNNRAIFGVEAGVSRVYYFFTNGGSGVVSLNSALSDISIFNKIAIKWKENDFALWVNGVEVGTDTSGTTPSAGTFNSLLFTSGGSSQSFNGKVKQLQVYDTSLTDNQLIQLTGEAGTHFFESYAEMAEALTYTIQ